MNYAAEEAVVDAIRSATSSASGNVVLPPCLSYKDSNLLLLDLLPLPPPLDSHNVMTSDIDSVTTINYIRNVSADQPRQ